MNRKQLKPEQVRKIYLSNETLSELAARFDRSISSISFIKCGHHWPDITGHLGTPRRSTAIPAEIVIRIYEDTRRGDSGVVIAARYGVSSRSVSSIKTGTRRRALTRLL